MNGTAAIVLAAGKSTRMKSNLPKVLHEICGQAMLGYVMSTCRLAGIDRLVVIVGHGKDRVIERFADARDVTWVEQSEQKGTGHAVLCARDTLKDFSGSVLVIAGDMPLVRRATVVDLLRTRSRAGDAVTLATTVLDDPTGYGRIIRDAEGRLEAIVEHRDATEQQRAVREVNPSYYCFDASLLFDVLEGIETNAQSGEHYVTDAVLALREQGHRVSATVSVAAEDATGINSRVDLATVGRIMQDRIQLALLNDGVTIVDPDTTWIEANVSVGRETTVFPLSFVGAGATIGARCRIGPLASIAAGETVPDGAVVSNNAGAGARIS